MNEEIESIINRFWQKLKEYRGVLSIRAGSKFIGGKDVGKPCITFYVVKKLRSDELSQEESIPRTIEGAETDVVELSTKDFVMGETRVSRLSPEQQKRIASGVKK